ncbi:MAG: hypothetical protein GXP42_01480 [Chloroflexi bacterium]|nr:hypothetical protein [Chloroflexota bacterium]
MNTLSQLTADFVIYRNLQPYDPRVPGLQEAWREMGLPGPQLVRKREPAYALVATWFLRRFHALHASAADASELLFIGDTLGNDGGAFIRLSQTSGWKGAAFIGKDALDESPHAFWQGDIYVANRWQSLADWLAQLPARGLALDERTVVVVDIDKTALGARGRNHRPIDQSRLLALKKTVLAALGPDADLDAFERVYRELNTSTYHDLTGDNQDYLAYISVMVGAGVISLSELRREHEAGRLNAFEPFLMQIHARRKALPIPLAEFHQAVHQAHLAHDPTPFKDFRRNEYLAAVALMGNLPDEADAARRAQEEICLTREVWDACQWLLSRGAVITALSDKPDEACAPSPELAAQGYRPIHHTPTHLLGEALPI